MSPPLPLPAEGANSALRQIPCLELRGHFEAGKETVKGRKGREKEMKGRKRAKRTGESPPPRNKYLVTALASRVETSRYET